VHRKVNKDEEVGQWNVPNRADQIANWYNAMQSTLNHYRDDHRDKFCGRLRKGQVCVPFRVFAACNARIEQKLVAAVDRLVEFVFHHDNVTSLTLPYNPREQLIQWFQIDE
jgi:hypothetical protein